MNKAFSVLTCLLVGVSAFCQTTSSTIFGQVIDKDTKRPIEFANIELLRVTDSATVSGVITDAKGKFSMDAIKAGQYLLKYGFIGYEKLIMPVTVSGKTHMNLGSIEIKLLNEPIHNVTVSSSKPMLNTSIDRKSYDVTKDIMAQSGTASDVLKNIPSVEVDIEGNVSLRGSGDVLFLINGRTSPQLGKLTKAEVLQQFPANTIDRIEVITNPSARYKPDGTAGIINIILKKNIKGGWNGSATANMGNQGRYNGSATLNYKPGKLNIFGNIGIRQDSRNRNSQLTRESFDPISLKTSGYYTDNGVSIANPLTHLATIGATYNPNKQNSFGISGNYSNRDQVKNDVNNKVFYDKNHQATTIVDRLRFDPETEMQKDLTAFWEHQFSGDDHSLRMELNLAKSNEVEDNHYQNKYSFPGTNSTYDNTRIGQASNQQQLTIDYSNTITESSKIEAGYSGSFNQQDFDFRGEYYDPVTGKFVVDKIKTNQFLYNEIIHGLYGTYQKSYEKFSYSLGLRMEESIIRGNQVTRDTLISNNYFKIYPTLHLAYILKNGQLQLNYSRRVHRPEGDDINPFPEWQDPYNVRAGNAQLQPEIIHSVEFGYKWQSKIFSFVPSLYYRYKQNAFTQVSIPISDSVLLTTQQNLSNDQSAGLELIFSAKANKIFSANFSTNFFYNQIDASNLGYIEKKSILSFSTNFNSSMAFTENTMAQISANYRSARLTPQGKNYPSFVLNIGVRQDFLKKKMSVLLSVSDILRTLQEKSELNTAYIQQVSIRKRDAQIIYLGVSYRFGKTIKKTDEKMQFDNGQ